MSTKDQTPIVPRRTFIGGLMAAIGMLSVPAFAKPLEQYSEDDSPGPGDANNAADNWFNKIKGKHRVVFDATQPHEVMPFAWPRVFLETNKKTGTAESDCGVVVVLRHSAIAYAFEDRLWSTYGFGEVFKANDPKTEKPSMRNPFWKPAKGDFKLPGVGDVPIGINELQASGVLFCVCEMAIHIYTNVLAEGMKKDPAAVKQDWMKGLLPGIQLVPSGVWALGRAQEHGCKYIFAG